MKCRANLMSHIAKTFFGKSIFYSVKKWITYFFFLRLFVMK